jgi:hypothetical protein
MYSSCKECKGVAPHRQVQGGGVLTVRDTATASYFLLILSVTRLISEIIEGFSECSAYIKMITVCQLLTDSNMSPMYVADKKINMQQNFCSILTIRFDVSNFVDIRHT